MTEYIDYMADTLFAYYGLDWMTMILGLWGGYLLTKKKSVGFGLNFTASLCALAVALMSGQYGFIIYNFFFMIIALKGYRGWTRDDGDLNPAATEVA